MVTLLSSRMAIAGLALLLIVTGCTDGTAEKRQVRIATGSPTAVYYAIGTAMGEIIERELPATDATVLATAASAENMELVARGAAEVGFAQADVLVTGGEPAASLVALARVYDDLLHLVVRSDSTIDDLTDLDGRRVSVGARGSGTTVTVGRLLSVAGMSDDVQRRELSLDDSIVALERGAIDAFFFSGGLPVSGIKQLGAEVGIRIVDLSDWAGELRDDYGDVYAVRDVPTSAYSLPPVATVAVPNLLVVSANMPEDLAYDLTRLLLERRGELAAAHPAAERLELRAAISTLPVPLHPGAARYYKSVKP
ncbi:TAXI family TRAP transporter solute-binding subunit [Actinoplanes sp. NPDC023801]|uniref:TAXI family TRAP transporter solute-binding subunit n=1 Tax=Actinoplanes sp. NPDC023801 TaxID=3154595 RepID=UPI0033E60D34